VHPQIYSWEPIVNGILMVLGTLTTLIYFQYGARQSRDGKIRRGLLFEILAWTGKVIAGISFGAIFAGVLSATITAMVERVAFLINFLRAMGG
jgi:Na+/proline symporter